MTIFCHPTYLLFYFQKNCTHVERNTRKRLHGHSLRPISDSRCARPCINSVTKNVKKCIIYFILLSHVCKLSLLMINEIVAHGIRLFFSFGIRSSAPLLVHYYHADLQNRAEIKKIAQNGDTGFLKQQHVNLPGEYRTADTNFYIKLTIVHKLSMNFKYLSKLQSCLHIREKSI